MASKQTSEDNIDSIEEDGDNDDSPTTSSKAVRTDTVLSEGGDQFDILPIPSSDVTALGNSGPGALSNIEFKPIIPYMSIYGSASRMLVGLNSAFLSKTKVTVRITDVKRDVTYRHPLNPNLYAIEVTHGQFKWVIYKRFKHFLDLHEKLWTYQTSLKLPIPSKRHRQKRKSRHATPKQETKIPRFPKKPELMVSYDEIDRRKRLLELYLNAVLESRLYRNHSSTKNFLQVSRVSFVQDLGAKGKEGVIKKRSGGHKIQLDFCMKCCNLKNYALFAQWKKRWFIVKDTFVAYFDPEQEKIKGVLLFDALISVLHENPSRKLVISNSSRSLNVSCWTDRQALEWKNSIEHCIANDSAGLTDPDIRYQSLAPPRPDSLAHWFVDGRTYMNAVADAIENAKEEIFITDWWLSPEIYLKRPITEGDHWRLDMVLKRKAAQGVKIYVQLYKEVEVAVGLDSAYTKKTLQKLHPTNIKVLRHPDLTPGESLLWAHHEKIVVVDQVIAFVGGIDLCYGRWDDQFHKLTDVTGVVSPSAEAKDVIDGGEGRDGSNQRPGLSTTGMVFGMFGTMTMGVVNEVSTNEPEKDVPKPPPPESTGSKEGKRIKKFLQRGKKDTIAPAAVNGEQDKSPTKREGSALALSALAGFDSLDESTPLMSSQSASTRRTPRVNKKEDGATSASSIEPAKKRSSDKGAAYLEQYSEMLTQVEQVSKGRLWIGKDYNNFILKDLTNLDQPWEDEIDRTKVARMPWHDIACVTYGKAARDVGRHFIQRWNFTKLQKKKQGEVISYLFPKTYSDEYVNIPKNSVIPEAVKAKVQILRSSSEWSAGISVTDRSIQNAYLDAINTAEHYIYIENQFFISCRNNSQVRNSITEALYNRILWAHRAKKNFRVYVIMPLIPGFEGDISDQRKSQAIRAVLDWQYKSISRGPGSLLESLNTTIGQHNTLNYVSFCGLRTHSMLNGKAITEMIYVHSKMLIVDDRLVIIGSANINDRSMSGVRDSEVAMLIEDTEMVTATMDGKPTQVGKYAAALRRRCFCEHLGFLPENFDGSHATFNPLTNECARPVEDVVSDHFFKEVWTKTAAINTTVYEKVFKCVPSDSIKKLSKVHEFQKDLLCDIDPEAAEKELNKVKGYLVMLPLYFLIKEDLTPRPITKEGIVPIDLWT